MAAIVAQDVGKQFGERWAVQNLNLTIPAGEITSLLGPNGAGKTTTIEMIAGLQRPTTGQLSVLGANPWDSGAEHRSRVGVMLQNGGVWSSATPKLAIDTVARFFAQPLNPATLLAEMGLNHVANTQYRRLSGGEQQRVKLALALVGQPQLLLLDEPSAGLDPSARNTLWEKLSQLAGAGTTILLSTHSFAEAEALANHHIVMSDGTNAGSGSTAELSGHVGQYCTFSAEGLSLTQLQSFLGNNATLLEVRPGHYRVEAAQLSSQILADLTGWCARAGITASELHVGGPSLEEAYYRLTKEKVAS